MAGKRQVTKRRFIGGGARPDNRAHRQREALERNSAWEKLSHSEKLKALDARLGDGRGATKQRAKLLKLVESAKQTPAPVPRRAEARASKQA